MSDWMDRLAAAAAEGARQERLRQDSKVLAEETLMKMGPAFVASVFSAIDNDVNRWNGRPSSAKILVVNVAVASRCLQYGDRTLNLQYSSDMQMLDVDITVGDGVYVAPNIVADSYVLAVRDGDVVATPHGTSRRGTVPTPEQVSEEILTALLS